VDLQKLCALSGAAVFLQIILGRPPKAVPGDVLRRRCTSDFSSWSPGFSIRDADLIEYLRLDSWTLS
jgi:hypothetical protein